MNVQGENSTRGERMLALRKARMAAAPPILRGGFRPFFFLGSAWAALALLLWVLAFFGGLTLPGVFDALSWHRHEMLFGFVGAIVAGFLLTAIPNWTGRLPIAGAPLAALAGLWIAARVALYWSGTFGIALAAALDVGFYLVFAFVAGREVVAAKNRNLPLVGLVLLFALANAADYAGMAGIMADSEAGVRAGISLVVLMISLVGGRIVPSFTRNWMSKKGWTGRMPGQPTRFDQAALGATGIALFAWLIAPVITVTGGMLVLAGVLQFIRLVRWRGLRTVSDPLVLVLHVGYLWISLGLLLLGISMFDPTIPRTAAIHALTTGAMATMILAVMTRATLGHTGRELQANAATIAIFVSITLAAIIRVATSLGFVVYRPGMEIAGGLWVVAFLLFLFAYGPILFRARLGKEAG